MGLSRVEWVHKQRPMWREHDAMLASLWSRKSLSRRASDAIIVLPEAPKSSLMAAE